MTLQVKIEGVSCAGCAKSIENALARHPRVDEAKVDFAARLAPVEGEIGQTELLEMIRRLGFDSATY